MKRTSKKNNTHKVPNKKIASKEVFGQSFFKKNFKYLFLAFVVFYILIDLYYSFTNLSTNEAKTLLNIKKLLTIPTIVIGILSIYFNKSKLTSIINTLFNSEKKDKANFTAKIKTHFSKKELLTTTIFILLLGISIFTTFNKLDDFDIYSDEVSVTKGAAGYMHTGEFTQWDFIKEQAVGNNYNRAKPHQWVVAQSFKMLGVNALALRLPSALFSFFLIALIFLIGNFFLKDKIASLLASFSFVFYYDFLALARWGRMYAILMPLFLISFYWLYKFLNDNNKISISKLNKNLFFNKYLSFNYLYLLPLLFLVILNLKIHQNSTLLFIVYLLTSFISIFIFIKEKKYITATFAGTLILIFQIIKPYKVSFSRFTFFEVDNSFVYLKALFAQPFSEYLGLSFLMMGLFIFFFIKNRSFKKKYLMLFVATITTYILFAYVFKYPAHYRYVSFVSPISTLLIVGVFTLIVKTLYNKYIRVFLFLLVVVSVIIKFAGKYDNLYITNSISPAKPSVAHKSIVENYKKGDVIFRHYGPKIYMKGIDKDTKFIDIAKSNGIKSFYEIFEQLKKYNSGWIIWHTYYSWKVDKSLINYCNLYFKKYKGMGIDKTGEEVYYFNKKMIHSTQEFKIFENLPTANLKLSNSYSFVFELKIDSLTQGNIFTFKKDSIKKLSINIKNGKINISNEQKTIASSQIANNKANTITILQDARNNFTKFSIILNGKKLSENEIATQKDLVKFQINPYFNGNIDKIRLYDFVLNNEQISEIQKDTKGLDILKTGNKEFKVLYLWKKNK